VLSLAVPAAASRGITRRPLAPCGSESVWSDPERRDACVRALPGRAALAATSS